MQHDKENSFIPSWNKALVDIENQSGEGQELELTYTYIYHDIAIKFDLSQNESVLLHTIFSLSKIYGHCYASQGTLARKLHISVVTVASDLDSLYKKSLITRMDHKGIKGVILWRVSQQVDEFVRFIQHEIKEEKQNKKNRKPPKFFREPNKNL